MEATSFKEKHVRIALVSGSSTIRNLHRDILKNHGFTNTVSVNDLKGAIEVLETENVDWLICPVHLNDQVNAFQILKLALSHPRAKQLKITLLVKEEEEKYLPSAFDYGVFSYMQDKTTRNEMEEQYGELFTVLLQSDWNLAKTSAFYIRKFLKNNPKDLLEFNQKMLQIFPGDPEIICDLAESLFLNKNKKAGLQALKQATTINPELQERAKALSEKYASLEPEAGSLEEQNTLGIQGCMIIDNDENAIIELKETLTALGIPKILVYTSPEEALEYVKKNADIDLVISEWALKTIMGPIFIQKIKRITHMVTAPIIVYNAKVSESDLPVLMEIGAVTYINKPLNQKEVLKKIIWTVQQKRLPTEPGAIEYTIRQSLGIGDVAKAKSLFGKLLKTHQDYSYLRKLRLQAEFAFYDGKFEQTKDHCLEAIKYGETSVFILSLLGKCLIKSRDYRAALRCFDLANSRSPLNIDRICEISECHMGSDDFEEAQKSIEEAENLDKEAPRIKESKTKLALSTGDVKTAKALMEEISSLREVIGFMNNRAVSLSLCQRVDEGINLYKQAIESLPINRQELLILIQYNLALAYAREGKLQSSLDVLKAVLSTKEGKNHLKIKSLYQRVNQSVSKGQPFSLKTNPVPPKSSNSSKEEEEDFFSYISLRPGEMCCHKIFVLPAHPKEIDSAYNKNLAFNPRQMIKKENK